MTSEAMLPLLDHLCNEARNSMQAAFGLAELQPEPVAQPEWHAWLQASRSSADRLLRTIDDLRELAAGPPQVRESAEQFDLTLCVGEVALVLNFAGESDGAKLMVDPKNQPVLIYHPRQALEQLLARVLKLVWKLTSSGTAGVSVEAAEQDRVRLSIFMPDAAPAHKLSVWMNATEGCVPRETSESGLILAAMVAGNRLRALGASVEFVDHTIVIHFRTHMEGLREEGAERETPALQVLVAEDCDESYALTALQLRNEKVDRAPTGLDAVKQVKQRRFDVVFMDVHMPGVDGYEAIRQIRDWETISGNARTPIVVLSSDDLATQTRRAAQSGCSGFLRKPVRMHELREVLEPLRALHGAR